FLFLNFDLKCINKLYYFRVNGREINIPTKSHVTDISKLLTPENAVIVLACSGYNSTKRPSAAAVITPLPTPVAIANANGLKGKLEISMQDKILNILDHNIVPNIYIYMTHCKSGE